MSGVARVQVQEVLPRVLAFQEELARRSAQTLVTIPGGFAVLNDRYPASYEHNQVYVTGSVAGTSALRGEADRLLRTRRHRYLTVLRDRVGRALATGMLAAGYEQDHIVVMALAGAPPPPPAGVRVERVPLEALREAVTRSWTDQYPSATDSVRTQLFERRFATAAACELSSHVVRVNGSVVSWCHLYRLGDRAQVESVNTLPEWRDRGFAKAVVLDATAAALEQACDLVFLVADREDWPRYLYERLGFATIGEQHSFLRA
jgi:ribosomal protein S18 acetylase RimI-like enzyme